MMSPKVLGMGGATTVFQGQGDRAPSAHGHSGRVQGSVILSVWSTIHVSPSQAPLIHLQNVSEPRASCALL